MALAVIALAGLVCSGVYAQKGGGTGGGTIYFLTPTSLSTMNSDGSSKTALPVGLGEPSRALHNGHRWLLQVRDVLDEGTYPSQSTYNTRREIFAVRDDGYGGSLQLTNQLDLEANFSAMWVPGDGQISWIARRWGVNRVTEGGVYTAAVVYNGAGDVTGLSAQPTAPTISVGLVMWNTGPTYYSGDLAPDMGSHDWAPGGTQIVYDRVNVQELHIASSSSNQLLLAGDGSRAPVWSPDNTLIAFNSSGGIDTISPAGTGLKNIIKWGPTYSVGSPHWSPTGTNLIYSWWNRQIGSTYERDIYRTTSTGGSKTNLTGDINGHIGDAFPIGWR